MKRLTVKLLVGRSGANGSNSPGDEIDLPIAEALRLIDAGSAGPVDPKAYDAARAAHDKAVAAAAQREARARDLANREALETELTAAYGRVVDLEARLADVHLGDEARAEMIDQLRQRDGRPALPDGDTGDDTVVEQVRDYLGEFFDEDEDIDAVIASVDIGDITLTKKGNLTAAARHILDAVVESRKGEDD